MCDTLVTHFSFTPRDVTILTDNDRNCGSSPTGANIKRALAAQIHDKETGRTTDGVPEKEGKLAAAGEQPCPPRLNLAPARARSSICHGRGREAGGGNPTPTSRRGRREKGRRDVG
jgi:hypothetical protein